MLAGNLISFVIQIPGMIKNAKARKAANSKPIYSEKNELDRSLKLAMKGSVISQEKVAYLYHHGKHVQDYEKAFAWYSIARENGSEFADQALVELNQNLDANMISNSKKIQLNLTGQITNEN